MNEHHGVAYKAVNLLFFNDPDALFLINNQMFRTEWNFTCRESYGEIKVPYVGC